MSFFKKDKKVFGMKFMVRMIVAFFTIIILGVSGTILMAGWIDNNNVLETETDDKYIRLGDINEKTLTLFSGNNDYPARIYTQTSSDPLYIQINQGETYIGGNVGIQTTEPMANLHVEGYEIRHTRTINNDIYGTRELIGGNKTVIRGIHPSGGGYQYIITYRNDNGYVGIGTYDPSSRLDVAGTTTSTNYACSSDARYKKNISPYENALEKVLGLRGVSYFWKTDEFKERNFSKDKQIGFIAQEVEKVIPELVFTDDKGYKTMSYDRLTAVIVEAIKELKNKNDSEFALFKKENAALKQEIATIKQENSKLKQRLKELDLIADKLATLEKSIGKTKIALR